MLLSNIIVTNVIIRQMIRLSSQAMLTTTQNSKDTNAGTAMMVSIHNHILQTISHITGVKRCHRPQMSNRKKKCSRCGKTFKSGSSHHTHFFDKHVKEEDGSMKPHCEPCLVVFASVKRLKTHCTHSANHQQNMKFV